MTDKMRADWETKQLNEQIKGMKEIGLIITKEISDGYHTFDELYHHRAVLFAVICNTFKDKAWKSKKHHDGTMFGEPNEMFIVGVETSEGQYSYHYHIDKYWDMYEVKELEFAPEWDGHQPEDIIRLLSLLKQSE